MNLTTKDFLQRGLVGGLAGGVAAALFTRFVTETQIGWAIGFEDAAGLGAKPGEAAEFARSTQNWGGMAATTLYGLILGVILAVVVAALHGQTTGRDEFGRVFKIAAAAFVATALVPWLKYPANPPTVGDPDTIGQRTTAYLALVLIGTLLVFGARWIWKELTARGFTSGTRFLLAGLSVGVVVTAVLVAFPANPDRIEPPNNDAAPALRISADTPPAVLDAMLANAKEVDDESYRDPKDPSKPLAVDELTKGSELIGVPVAISTTKLTPHAYTTMVWSFRLRSLAGLALLWAVMAAVMGLLLDRKVAQGEAAAVGSPDAA